MVTVEPRYGFDYFSKVFKWSWIWQPVPIDLITNDDGTSIKVQKIENVGIICGLQNYK